MCQLCGLEQTTPKNDTLWKIPLCSWCEQRNVVSSMNGEQPVSHASNKLDPLSPCATPRISPSPSLSEFGSCLSNFDDFHGHMITQRREDGADGLDPGQTQSSPGVNGVTEHAVEHENKNLLKDINTEHSSTNSCSSGPTPPMLVGKNYRPNSLALEDCNDNGRERAENHIVILGEDQPTRSRDGSDEVHKAVSRASFLANGKTDPHIWIPPEPEDMEQDMDSVANNDDDDDDGTWGQSSSLSGLNEEFGNHNSSKEERKKAMMEAMNGQFKVLVSRLLASEGIDASDRGDGENWLDIVTSLSWEAALLIKPDANEGQAMDPGSYVKVKCIASGSRSQSQVVNGLVFKKNTAHKHMPTNIKNPRLLLIKGSVGQSAAGLSSLRSMEQENDYKKYFIEMIESCNPNVVLVEKSISRDIQGSLLDKRITLVFDVKLPRLERIARCTGSQIISSTDILVRPKLTHCDSFHIEKFVEEHSDPVEGGKKPSKTLMFLEGCPRPLGCTILLRGAHSDELKKIKHVVHYSVFAAHHLILETSFFADQRTFFYDMPAVKELNGSSRNESVTLVIDSIPISHNRDSAITGISSLQALDIPISDVSIERPADDALKVISDHEVVGSFIVPGSAPPITFVGDNTACRDLFGEPDGHENGLSYSSVQTVAHGQLLSSVSASIRRFLGDNIPPLTANSISSYFGFNDKMSNSENTGLLISPQPGTFDHGKAESAKINEEVSDDGIDTCERAGVESDRNDTTDLCSEKSITTVQIEGKDDIESALDPQSILILMSSYCIPKQTVCEPTHLSRIKYYGNFDVSLGRYLQDILLSQKYHCSSCGQPPEDHVYRYTHQNGSLTVLVRRLPKELALSGEAEGKIWMWTHCLKCEQEMGTPMPTRRVVLSSAARGLSFGKFLELSFSGSSAARRLSRCGHLLHRDCLRFFGLGSKVAMFQYTSVEIYAACKPPPMLEFCNPSKQEWFLREARDVLTRGDLLFTEIADLLEELKPKYLGAVLKLSRSVSGLAVKFDEIEKMLTREKSEFEASLLMSTNHSLHFGSSSHEILDLNWLTQELIFMLYIWDRRLHSIFLHTKDRETSNDAADKQLHEENDVVSDNKFLGGPTSEYIHDGDEASNQIPVELENSLSNSSHPAERNSLETKLETEPSEVSRRELSNSSASMTQEQSPSVNSLSCASHKAGEEECIPINEDQITQGGNCVPVVIGPMESVERAIDLELRADGAPCIGEAGAHESQKPEDFKLEDPNWIWAPYTRLRKALRQDLYGGSLQKFEFVNAYSPTYLSPMRQLSSQVMDSLHFPVGSNGDVISVIEDEISSIIACALALLEENSLPFDKTFGKEESFLSFTSMSSMTSPDGSSTGSFGTESMKTSHSFPTLSSDQLASFASDGSLFSDGLIPMENQHPEIPVGAGKFSGKSRYSVVCMYAKQFHSLRKRCCSSEMAYISSLSRCKKWDAQGGKSKVVFAKTMDDRFIIKQIKKTELESFLKFGPDYFKHISLSLDSGSQTCLAKILGIYHVRQFKNGKEVKIDVAVMENIFFGRNISRKYDLKGAVFSRYITNSDNSESVFLDENFVEDMRISPLYIGGKNKHLLQRAIWNDTSFLTSINVMDYSLLVGVDKKNHEIVFGIIDYLRQYTWDKQLETWVKTSLVVPKNELPTVISPREYKKRFRKFMSKYFLTVPDAWNPLHCPGSCKDCNDGRNDSHNPQRCPGS